MVNYKKMYTVLFNQITDVINILQKAQQQTEEMFIEEKNPIMILPINKPKDNNSK